MDSLPWLITLLLAFFLILVIGLALLYLHLTKGVRTAANQQAEFLAKTLEIQVALTENSREAVESQLEATAKREQQFLEKMAAETASRLEANQQATIRTIDLMATRATTGSQTSSLQIMETLKSTLTLLGTKDPIAYQMVRGASPIPDDGDTSPYTSADEVALQQAQLADLDAAAKILENLGMVDDGAGIAGSYSTDAPL